MSPNDPKPTPTHESRSASHEQATDVESTPIGAGRKPYARPRLIEHGRLTALTLGSPVVQSDRNSKEQFEVVDPTRVLAAVARLPLERWSYKGEAARHLGPMAQDFHAAFGLGADDRHIFTLDAAGVALAAIQALHGLVRDQQARLEMLERELTALRGETAALHAELACRQGEPVA